MGRRIFDQHSIQHQGQFISVFVTAVIALEARVVLPLRLINDIAQGKPEFLGLSHDENPAVLGAI